MSDQDQEPQKINRLDPLWTASAAAMLPSVADDVHQMSDAARIECGGSADAATALVNIVADFADAMLRERDRRDREEQ